MNARTLLYSLLLCSVIACDRSEAEAEFTALAEMHQRQSAQTRADIQARLKDLRFQYSYPGRIQYRFLLDSLLDLNSQLHARYQVLQDQIEHWAENPDVSALQANLRSIRQRCQQLHSTVVLEKGRTLFGLRLNEPAECIERYQDRLFLDSVELSKIPRQLQQASPAATMAWLRSWECRAWMVQYETLESLRSFTLGRVIGYDWDFLVITTPKHSVCVGEPLDLTIGITGDSKGISDSIRFVVNGDTLVGDKNNRSRAHYRQSKPAVGLHRLDIEVLILNPYTQQIESSKQVYEYRVLPR